MIQTSYDKFSDCYKDLCETLIDLPLVSNTHELNNLKFTINDINSCTSSIRNMPLHYMCGELLWYLNGSNKVDFISKFGTMWKTISDDGITNNSAYGYILKEKHGFNQIEKIIELLKEDKDSRRAVLNINIPNENVITTKDEMCTIALQFLVRDNKVHCTAIMRSNDIWFGLPYDIIYFTTIQKYIADSLGYEYGTYTHFAVSFHMYCKDERKVMEVLKSNTVQNIKLNHKNLIKYYKEIFDKVNVSDNPKEEVVKLFKEYKILEVKE